MPVDEMRQARFISRLAAVDFARRYYEYSDQCRNRARLDLDTYDRESAAEVLTGLRPGCRYFKSERFFRYTDSEGGHDFLLNVASLHHSMVELVFFDKTFAIGGAFQVLAKEAGELADPPVARVPPYALLEFGNLEEMREAFVFGLSLYDDIKGVILAGID